MNGMRLLIPSLLVMFLAACGKPPEPAPTGPPPILLPTDYEWLKPAAASALMEKTPGLGVIDVRDDSELGSGTLPKAQRLPWDQDPTQQLASMDRNRPWLVYCAIGGRSELLAQKMAKMEFKRVYLLRGGFNAWQAAGLPVQK